MDKTSETKRHGVDARTRSRGLEQVEGFLGALDAAKALIGFTSLFLCLVRL